MKTTPLKKPLLSLLGRTKQFLIIGLLLSTFAACSKSDPVAEEPDDNDSTPTNDEVFYKLERVNNFYAQADDENPTVSRPTAYFSLESKKEINTNYSRTNRWDIAFGGLYNSFISSNNGKESTSNGYGSTGKGGLIILKESFNDVVDVPSDDEFSSKLSIGTDDVGAYGEGTGWYMYDFGGNLMSDGKTENKKHVAYALSEGITLLDGTEVKPRTIIVRTAKGNIAKLRVISCYKDLLTPDKWFKDSPKMYFTFEYVIVPAGSKKFEIK